MLNKELVQNVNNCLVVECDYLNKTILLTEKASTILKSCKFDKDCAIIIAFASGNYSLWCKQKGHAMSKNSLKWMMSEIDINSDDSNLATAAMILSFYEVYEVNVFKFVKC